MEYKSKLYNNDLTIRKYWENNDKKLLNNLIIYNYNIGYIINLIPNNTIINIYDNDTGLLGYALRELQFTSNYIRSSKCPLHCVLITSFENKSNKDNITNITNINNSLLIIPHFLFMGKFF